MPGPILFTSICPADGACHEHFIRPARHHPTTYLDGTSQPSCNVPCIVLSGALLTTGLHEGLVVRTSYSLVKGFIMTSWSYDAIAISGNGNSVKSNDIGFWPGNPSHLPNGAGVYVWGLNNHIGGMSAGDRNVISGNSDDENRCVRKR